jgi:molybdopterin molybdotransferase
MNNSQTSCTDIHESGLISVKDAVSQILSDVPAIQGYERLNIEKARGRTLYEPVIAAFNVPPFTNSAVDGYAMYSYDLPVQGECRLEVIGRANAGKAL